MSEIVLVESNRDVKVTVVLQKGGMLEGKVVDSRGRGIDGAHVTALATHGALEHLSRTGTDGSFAFAAMPTEVVLLVARDEDPTAIVARLEVTVPEGGKKNVEIVIPEPRPALPVRVLDTHNTGIEAAQVSAVSLDAANALRTTAFTDPRGECKLPGGKGISLRIEIHAPGRAGRVVTTTPDTEELKIELAPAESLTGEVVTKRREPIAGAELTLTTDAGVRHARTGPDGKYVFAEVAPGPGKLRVRATGRTPDEREIAIEDKGGRKPTEIARFELGEEGIVEGTVVNDRGDPIPGARVAKDAVPTYLPVGAAPVGMAVTDGKGRFKLAELGEGTVTLEAYAADIGRARKLDVRVIAGRTTVDVKIVIARGEGKSNEPIATGGVAITLADTDEDVVFVAAVSPSSEAERGGILPNDVIVDIGGKPVANIAEARARLSGPVNDDVLVRVHRGDQTVVLRIAREAVRR